ncbi:cytidylyltransferase domain-containing protein [Pseudoalteromonas sp. T1lg23B]|uniref:cytidylyltransferase domain-containing protein n=1 Tax=Pseudoalteromonas sp. T1lg23B TaxID=2077097 RepID=UPI000CF68C57|nr:glycosyltransferase family protein [Pseudoalteromonas sp. T1lg23B]
MKNVQIIIQARMTSTRLPGKVMLPLCNSSVLQTMLERLPNLHDNIIIATTNDGSESPIIELCKNLNIKYFRGETDDVLGRYYYAAKQFGANEKTTIVRLTSDCPLIDEALCLRVINKHLCGDYDIVSLGPHSGYPRGLDCCAFGFNLLSNTHQKATLPADREHVTLGMTKFNEVSSYIFSALEDLSHLRLTLDEQDDYTAIKQIYGKFGNKTDFSYSELIKTLKKFPELTDINKHVEQKNV